MNEDAVGVNRIDLESAFPSLRLVQALRTGCSLQGLVPAAATILGFAVLRGDAGVSTRFISTLPVWSRVFSEAVPAPVLAVVAEAHAIFAGGFSRAAGLENGLPSVLWLVLLLLIISMGAVSIARGAGVSICIQQRTGVLRSIRHALRQWKSIVVAVVVLIVLGTIAFLCFRTSLFIATRLPSLASGIVQFAVWLQAMLMIALGGIFGIGWTLSVGAIGVDSCSGAEALSRGISYVLSRFWRTVCCLFAVILLVAVSLAMVRLLVVQAGLLVAPSLSASLGPDSLNTNAFRQFRWFVQETWKMSVFFSGVSAVYILLRYFEDNTSFNEIDGGRH